MVSRCGKPELHLTAAEDKVEEEEAIKVEEEVDAGQKIEEEVVKEEEVGRVEEERVGEYVLEEESARREIKEDTLEGRDEEEDDEV